MITEQEQRWRLQAEAACKRANKAEADNKELLNGLTDLLWKFGTSQQRAYLINKLIKEK